MKTVYATLVLNKDLVGGVIAVTCDEETAALFAIGQMLEIKYDVMGQLIQEATLFADGERYRMLKIVCAEFDTLHMIDTDECEKEFNSALDKIYKNWDIHYVSND